jgi:hypothetical protein
VIDARRPSLRDARDPWIVAGLIALAVIVPGLLAIASGAIVIPLNDDFAFRRTLETLYQTGRFQYTGWSVMTLVGQLLFTLPLMIVAGGSAWAFAASTAILSAVWAISGYDLARRVLPAPRAAFAVLTVLAIPGFLRYTTSYMTDVPTYAGEVLCLALGAVALQRTDDEHRWRWLVASLVVGCWAFSIREFALAAPVAVLIAAFASERNGRRMPYVVAGLGVVIACLAIYEITQHLPGQTPPAANAHIAAALGRVADAPVTLAFFLVPALILGVATWLPIWRRTAGTRAGARRRAIVGAVVGSAVALVLFADVPYAIAQQGLDRGLSIFIGTVFGNLPTGQPILLAGTRAVLFPARLWEALEIAALVAGFVAFALLGAAIAVEGRDILRALDLRRRPSPLGSVLGLLVIFAVVYGLGIIAFGVAVSVFDRYLWPMVLPIAIVLLWRPAQEDLDGAATGVTTRRSPPRPAAWLAGVTLLGMGVISSAWLVNTLAFDAARWRAGEAELARGVPATSIDAGFEWVGYHSPDIADNGAPFPVHATPYTRLWPTYHQCVVVSSSRLDWPGLRLAETQQDAYRLLLVAGPREPLYIYRAVGDPACPS